MACKGIRRLASRAHATHPCSSLCRPRALPRQKPADKGGRRRRLREFLPSAHKACCGRRCASRHGRRAASDRPRQLALLAHGARRRPRTTSTPSCALTQTAGPRAGVSLSRRRRRRGHTDARQSDLKEGEEGMRAPLSAAARNRAAAGERCAPAAHLVRCLYAVSLRDVCACMTPTGVLYAAASTTSSSACDGRSGRSKAWLPAPWTTTSTGFRKLHRR